MVVGVNILHHFEGKSYTDKVAKAFPETPSGYGATAKRSVWGGVKLPPPSDHMRVKEIEKFSISHLVVGSGFWSMHPHMVRFLCENFFQMSFAVERNFIS